MAEWGPREYAMWRLDTPNFLSYEDSEDRPGLLGVEWCDGCDNRWGGDVRLGPLLNLVPLTAAGGSAQDVNGFALSHTMNATNKYLYAIRGTKWAKLLVGVSSITLVSDDTETALGGNATDIMYTKNGAGVEEISIGMDSTAYRVITTVSATATDTHSANNETKIMRKFGKGTPAGVVVGMRGDAQIVEQNDISGATTMDASAWTVRKTIGGETFIFTGFAEINDVWFLGTSNGPYYFDNAYLDTRPLIEEIANTMEGPTGSFQNCDQMGRWYAGGILIPLEGRLRLMWSQSEGESVGPEEFDRVNTSPVQGQVTAIMGSREWLYAAIYNPVLNTSYLLAGHPREHDAEGASWHSNVISWYVIGTLGIGVESHAMMDIGYYGGRQVPTMVVGWNDDLIHWSEGRLPFFPNDSLYRYTVVGTVYLTELRRFPLSDKKFEGLTVSTAGCDSGKTITFSVSSDGGTTWTQVGAPIVTNGNHRVLPSADDLIYGRRLKLKADLTTDASSSSPRIVDKVTMHYRRRPLEVNQEYFEGEM